MTSGRTRQPDPYSKMAQYYDAVYHNIVNYEADCDILESLFQKHSTKEVTSILDAGCGTGTHSIVLAKRGYSVTGIDVSHNMISVAKVKTGSDDNPVFRQMDMRRIKLDKQFDAVLVLFGGFGYLTGPSDLPHFLSSVKNNLEDTGVLVFEFWQSSGVDPESYSPTGRMRWVRVNDKGRGQLIIRLDRSNYDVSTRLLTMRFEHYVLDIREGNLVDRFLTDHVVRTYSIPEIQQVLEENGFNAEAFYQGDGQKMMKRPEPSNFRVVCVARVREN